MLGFVLTNEGRLLPSEAKTQTKRNLSIPRTLKQVRSVIDQINFMRKLIPNASDKLNSTIIIYYYYYLFMAI